jgi:hypothetical protein
MPGQLRLDRRDAFALVSLIATAVVLAWPILTGGYFTYIDNPVHLAEIYELAKGGNGWSELGFAGLPVTTLHSPVFFPFLAALVRAGMPLAPAYVAFVLAGLVAPSVAFYLVARRRVAPAPAFVLAYLLLVQPSVVWGIGSPLAGMWTHGLASALLVLLFDLLARPKLSSVEHLVASLLLTLAVLTHLFVLPIVALMAAITTGMHLRRATMDRPELYRRAVGWAIAAVASAKYWLTVMWVSDVNAAPHPAFRLVDIAVRLFLPCEPLYLLDERAAEGIRYDLFLTDALPALVIVTLGVLGFMRRKRTGDRFGEAGFWLAVAVLACLFVHRYVPLRFLGPVSWRLIDWARIGFAVAALDVLSSPAVERLGVRALTGALALAPVLAVWWGLPLRRDHPEALGADVREVQELWGWLGTHSSEDWGRLYLEDAFGWAWRDGGLAQSHLLVLTKHHVGMPQLGVYYGVVPYKLRWTLSEFNSLFSTRNPSKEWILEAMGKTNAGALVTSNADMARLIEETDAFDVLHRTAHYTVFRLRDAEDAPIAELSPSNHVSDVDERPGEIRLTVRADYGRARILAKVAFHPFWHLEGAAGAWLRESPEGFLVIDDIPRGESKLHLWYEPSRVPGLVTALGCLLQSAWAFFLAVPALRRRRTKVAAA